MEKPLIGPDPKTNKRSAAIKVVILASKIAYEASRIPPTYLLPPYEKLMNDDRVNITSGLVNIPSDLDGFNHSFKWISEFQ